MVDSFFLNCTTFGFDKVSITVFSSSCRFAAISLGSVKLIMLLKLSFSLSKFFRFCLVSCLLSLISMNFGVYIGSFVMYVVVKYEWSELMFLCVVVFISLFGMFEKIWSMQLGDLCSGI